MKSIKINNKQNTNTQTGTNTETCSVIHISENQLNRDGN